MIRLSDRLWRGLPYFQQLLPNNSATTHPLSSNGAIDNNDDDNDDHYDDNKGEDFYNEYNDNYDNDLDCD